MPATRRAERLELQEHMQHWRGNKKARAKPELKGAVDRLKRAQQKQRHLEAVVAAVEQQQRRLWEQAQEQIAAQLSQLQALNVADNSFSLPLPRALLDLCLDSTICGGLPSRLSRIAPHSQGS